MSGFGRGGRGAALMAALQLPARKPGEAGPPSQQSPPAEPSTQEKPRGRASALKALLERGASAQTDSSTPPAPMGRASLIKKVMQAKQASLQAGGSGDAQQVTAKMSQLSTQEEESVLARRLARIKDTPIKSSTGKDGQSVDLAANSIRLRCSFKGMYMYSVTFSPQVDSRRLRCRMVAEHQAELGSVRNFDGSILCLLHKLPSEEVTLQSHREDGEEVTIRVKLVKALPLSACIQPLNVLFRKIMEQLKMVQVNRHYYNPSRKVPIPQHRLEVWPGYITAIEEQEGGLLLLCDVSHRVLRTETVLDKMQDLSHQKRGQNLQEEMKRAVCGVTVLTRYNNKTYRVDDIDFSMSPKDTFTASDGTAVRFVDYYKKMYSIEIRDLDQPLLIHRPKARERMGKRSQGGAEFICLVPELSFMTGLTDEIRKDFRIMKELASHTRVMPAQRQRAMRKFVEDVNSHPTVVSMLEKWGIQLCPDLISLNGRVLPPTDIFFRGGNKVSAGPEADWSRALIRNKVVMPVALSNWLLVFCQKDGSKVRDFVTTLLQEGPKMGLDIKPPRNNGIALGSDRTQEYLTAIRQNMNSSTQMVVCVFPSPRDDRYNAFKKLCCVECPVPSQAINVRTVGDQKKLRSVTQKIALQINCKLGGVLWGVNIPMSGLMVVGIDVYHESKRASIAGVVASMDSNCTTWYSRTCQQLAGQELVDSIRPCITAAIKKYFERNHHFPEKIFIFRDGVGDGQLRFVSEHEAPQVEHSFKDFGESYSPRLVYLVVQKRINQRVFARMGGQGGQPSLENPRPGTIVDHTITRRDWYDFFLISQHVRQGTVSPTHYVIVHDGGNTSVDVIQKLTYRLTHLYYNWPGTIRVPAPCQYAHKLAYQVGQNIRASFSLELADRLFYL